MRTPLEVGQIRDVASGPDRKEGVVRLCRVVKVGTPRSTISNLDGKRPREKFSADLERCPVVGDVR